MACPTALRHHAAMEDRPEILLVDDDAATILALSETLRLRLGELTVDAADTAANAIDHLRRKTYDVVVCDIIMPGGDGLMVLKEAQRLRPDAPVILMTAGGIDREATALYSGAYAFLEKPLKVDHFVSVVRAALAHHNLTMRVRERNQHSVSNLHMKALPHGLTSVS